MKTAFVLFIALNFILNKAFSQVASFQVPDTVCVNEPFEIKNVSTGASRYLWNFCVADIAHTPPTAVNLGNPNNLMTVPVFMDYVEVNGNYYGFLTDLNPNRLIRLDFGNSLLNTPTATDLGDFNGIIPPNTEGIQIVFNENKWYAIIVGGAQSVSFGRPRIVKIEFGTDIKNLYPIATNWGNIGELTYPVDLHIFKENNNWYGFTVNAEGNTFTRFEFGSSFDNPPIGVNLGNIGDLNYPTGIFAINNKGNWNVFITNAGGPGSNSIGSSLSRLDFGNSLLNTPTGVNLGNLNNTLKSPRDLYILDFCDQLVGFVVNYSSVNDIVRLNFNNELNQIPSSISLGNIGNLEFPHSISKLFRIGEDLYGFITNAYNNTITRVMFSGCTNASIAFSTQQNPTPIYYNQPGTYNINLTLTDGQSNEITSCKNITVVGRPVHNALKNLSFCEGDSIKIGTTRGMTSYQWNTFEEKDSILVNKSGTYWVKTGYSKCSNVDTIVVYALPKPNIAASKSNDITCINPTAELFVTGGNKYTWEPTTSVSDPFSSKIIVSPITNTTYYVTGENEYGCVNLDSVKVKVSSVSNFKALLPSAFSPNGDGLNDCFGATRWGSPEDFELAIYNRWGEKVFYTRDTKTCWNGYYKGLLQPTGIFVYYAKLKSLCGNFFIKGTVALIR